MRRIRILALALLIAQPVPAQLPDTGPAPGRLVDVGGRRLHLHCTGRGSPTVVIESGASAFAIDWALVQPEIAKTNRVCSYDRAGHGWSDSISAAAPRVSVYQDLHTLLQTAQEKPPYILVGASMGGIWVRRYQIDYPDDVAGMVLVDPAHEERLFTMYQGEGVTIASLTSEQLRSALPQRDFPIRPRPPQTGSPFDRLPPDLYALRVALDQRLIASLPTFMTFEQNAQGAEEGRRDLAKLREVGLANPHPFGDRPIVVLSRSVEGNQGMWDVHKLAAGISTNSRHTVVQGAGHEIHLFKPEAVIQAIRDVSDAVRTKSKLPPR